MIRVYLDRSALHGYSIFIETEKNIHRAKIIVAKIVVRLNRDYSAELFGCVAVTAKRVVAESEPAIVLPVSGTERNRFFKIINRALHFPLLSITSAKPPVGGIAHW